MPPIFLRIIYAVILVVVFWLIVPPLFRILGLPISGDMQTIVRVLVGFGALLYIIFGWSFPR